MKPETTCRIPVTAAYRIIDGEPVMVAAEYQDIPADALARFLLRAFGLDTERAGD